MTKILTKTETSNSCKKNKLSTGESSPPIVAQSDILNRNSNLHESQKKLYKTKSSKESSSTPVVAQSDVLNRNSNLYAPPKKLYKTKNSKESSSKVNLSAKREKKNWRTWRYLQADLNDVYSVGSVRTIRNLIIQDYLNSYHKIVDEQDRKMKIILDGYAKKELEKKLQTLIDLAENADTKAEENEAYLALSEINLTANNYSKACDYAQKVIADSEQEGLLVQAYYYLRKGYAKQGNVKKAEDYSRVLLKKFPKQADRILGLDSGSYPVETILRRQYQYLEFAEFYDRLMNDGIDPLSNRNKREEMVFRAYSTADNLFNIDDALKLH